MKAKQKRVTKKDVLIPLILRAEKNELTKQESAILEYWNTKGIVKHKPTLKFLKAAIENALEEYKPKEIMQAIDNYAEMLFSDYPYMDYAWKLPDFLSKHNTMPDFMFDGSKWKNYLRWKNNTQNQEADPVPKQESDCRIEEDIYCKYMGWLNSLPYDEYLKTEHWQHFRREALKDAQQRCRVCNVMGVELNVHHNNYSNRGRETFNDVVVLCKTCHGMFHAPDEIETPVVHVKIQ
jgi:hypothetical protein